MDPQAQDLVIELARQVVAQVAPHEASLFPAMSAQFRLILARPTRSVRDDRLAFGAADAVALLTPLILTVCAEVGQYLLVELKETLKERGAATLTARLKAMFDRAAGVEQGPPTFSTEQREQVRAIAFKKARQLNLDADRAHLLADAVVGSLASAQA
jgi:hypothetical protein